MQNAITKHYRCVKLQHEVQSECREHQPLVWQLALTPEANEEQSAPQPVLPRLDPLEASVTPQSSSLARFLGWTSPIMQPYHEDKDIEYYLTFKRGQVPHEEWSLHLAPLNGKAWGAYVAMDIDETMNYAILEKSETNRDLPNEVPRHHAVEEHKTHRVSETLQRPAQKSNRRCYCIGTAPESPQPWPLYPGKRS